MVDGDHCFVCSVTGRSKVHNHVRDVLSQLIARHASLNVVFGKKEVRGEKYFYDKDDNRGPDIEISVDGKRTFLDVTGIEDMAESNRKAFQNARTAENHTKRTVAASSALPRSAALRAPGRSPVEIRHAAKMASEDAKIAQENACNYLACVFLTNGGIDPRFHSLLIKCFGHADHEHKFAWGGDITNALEFAKQAITACIVNNHARYVMGNQKRLFKSRGMGDVQLRWWSTARPPTTTLLPDEHRSAMAAEYAETYGDGDAINDHGRQTVTRDQEPRYGAAASGETSNGNGKGRAIPKPRTGASVSGVDRGGGARGGGAVWGRRHRGGSSAGGRG